MPNLPQAQTIVQYVTNVSQTAYTFAFYAPLPTDIVVYYQSPTATPIPSSDQLLLNTNYTVTYNSDPLTGGTITLLFTPTTGYYLTINLQVLASLNTNFANAQTINGANLDAAFDRLLLLCQQNQNYALQRNLSYIINTYLPNATPYTQLPPLASNQIWMGSGSGVIAATLADSADTSVLRSQLASESPGTDGSRLVGYYDVVDSVPTTVQAFLANLVPFIQAQVIAQLFQPGDMKIFSGSTVQSGWLLCDGSAVSRTTYANLFAAIGVTWGAGNGTTTFNIPDMRRRTIMGSGGTSGAATFGVSGTTTGSTGGQEAHTQTEVELATHSHPGSNVKTNTFLASGVGTDGFVVNASSTNVSVTVAPDGSSTPFNVTQPTAVVTMIIKT